MESVAPVQHADVRPRPDWVRIRRSGITWIVDPAAQALFTAADAPNWRNLEHDRTATLVESNPRRRVWRISIGAKDVHVKEFLALPVGARAIQWIRGSPAEWEWRAGREATSRGIPCAHLIAVGRAGPSRWLVSETVAGATPLSRAWDNAGTEERNAVISAVANLVAAAHENGFVHGDDHPRNILIVAHADGRRHAVYTDLRTARVKTRITETDVVRSFAQLHQWFRLRATTRQVLRFLRAYRRARTGNRHADALLMVRRLLPMAAKRSRAHALQLWAKRDRRILTSNRYFAEFRLADGATAHVALPSRRAEAVPQPDLPHWSRSEWRTRLDEVSRSFRHGAPACRRVRIAERLDAIIIVFPRHRRWGWSDARRAFYHGHRLRNRDLPVPWPIVCIDHRDVSLLCLADPGESLSLVDTATALRDDIPGRRRACRSLARTVTLLSEQGAVVAPAAGDLLAYDRLNDRWIIPDASRVTLANPQTTLENLRAKSESAILKTLASANVFPKTDAIRFLTATFGWRWARRRGRPQRRFPENQR